MPFATLRSATLLLLAAALPAVDFGLRPSDAQMVQRDNARAAAQRMDAIRSSIARTNAPSSSSSSYNALGNAVSGSLHDLGQRLSDPGVPPEVLAESERRWQARIHQDEVDRQRRAAAERDAALAAQTERRQVLVARANGGDRASRELLSVMYQKGQGGFAQDAGQERKWLELAVAVGSDYAADRLDEVEADKAKVLAWRTTAAQAGGLVSQMRIGTQLYRGGDGVVADHAKALAWYEFCSQLGNREAMSEVVSLCIFDGEGGLPPDRKRAGPWLLPLARSGSATHLGFYVDWMAAGLLTAPDPAAAQGLLKDAAAAGHPLAAIEAKLAGLLLVGGPVPVDAANGVALLRAAVEHGSPAACCELGLLHQLGEVVPRDEVEAQRLFLAAGDHPQAQFLAATGLLQGVGTVKDVPAGMVLLRKAAAAGWPEAAYQYGMCAASGDGAPRDDAVALQMESIAAAAGIAGAQYLRGRWFITGEHGSIASDYQAFTLVEKGAAQGHPEALWLLGMCWANGIGRQPDMAKCVALVRQSAAAGCGRAEYDLGLWLMDGDQGLARDEPAGLALLRSSAAHGFADGQALIGRWSLAGEHGVAADPVAGVALLRAAAAQDHAPARRLLAICLLHGTGTAPDPVAAETMLLALAERDHLAATALGEALLAGDGLPRDPARGWLMLQKAAEGGAGLPLRLRVADHLLAQPGTTAERLAAMSAVIELVKDAADGDDAVNARYLAAYHEIQQLEPGQHADLFEETPVGRVAVAARKEGLALLAHGLPGATREEACRRALLKLDFACRREDRGAAAGRDQAQKEYAALRPDLDPEPMLELAEGAWLRDRAVRVLAESPPGKNRVAVCESVLFDLRFAVRYGDQPASAVLAQVRAEYLALKPDNDLDQELKADAEEVAALAQERREDQERVRKMLEEEKAKATDGGK